MFITGVTHISMKETTIYHNILKDIEQRDHNTATIFTDIFMTWISYTTYNVHNLDRDI